MYACSIIHPCVLQVGHRDFDVEKKLRRDLKRTHALLADAQLLLSTVDNPGQNLPNGSQEHIERLHCQVRSPVPVCSPHCHLLLSLFTQLSLSVADQLEESEARRLEAESIQSTLSQELENSQIELENICKQKSVVSVRTGDETAETLTNVEVTHLIYSCIYTSN